MTAKVDASASTGLFQEFFRTEAATGALLVFCAAAALGIANSPWAGAYHRLWTTPIAVVSGGHPLSLTLHGWINDGLMAVFFLLVGLEIKREVLAGELASPRQAALPIAAAIGGMIVPATIYVLANDGGIAARGWAIPMATDIAFALGALSLVAPRAPSGLKVFLAALAIVGRSTANGRVVAGAVGRHCSPKDSQNMPIGCPGNSPTPSPASEHGRASPNATAVAGSGRAWNKVTPYRDCLCMDRQHA